MEMDTKRMVGVGIAGAVVGGGIYYLWSRKNDLGADSDLPLELKRAELRNFPGYRPVGSTSANLEQGQKGSFSVNVKAGKIYALAAVADGSVSEIAIAVPGTIEASPTMGFNPKGKTPAYTFAPVADGVVSVDVTAVKGAGNVLVGISVK